MGSSRTFAKMVYFLIYTFVFSLPFNLKLANGILVLIIVVLVAGQIKAGTFKRGSFSMLTVLSLLYFTLDLIGMLYTENLRNGFQIIERHLLFLFIPFVFYLIDIDQVVITRVMRVFVVSCSLACVVCVLVNVDRSLVYGKIFHEWMFAHDQFSEPIGMQAVYFALYLALALLVLAQKSLDGNATTLRLPWIVQGLIGLVIAVSFVLLGARTIMITTFFLLMGLLFFFAARDNKLIYWGMAFAIPIFLVGAIYFHPVLRNRFNDLIERRPERMNYDSYNARFRIWKPGWQEIKENIWFGVGTGDAQTVLDQRYADTGYMDGIGQHNMHNQYLQVWLEHGVLGLLVLLGLIIVQLRRAIAFQDPLYLTFTILTFSAMCTESLLHRNKGLIFFLFFSFLFFSHEKQVKSE